MGFDAAVVKRLQRLPGQVPAGERQRITQAANAVISALQRYGSVSDTSERRMYVAVCADCRATFLLPFLPHRGRDVYCDRCMILDPDAARKRGQLDWELHRSQYTRDRVERSVKDMYKAGFYDAHADFLEADAARKRAAAD